MMHFPSVSDFFPISEKFSDSVENFPNFTFSRKIFRFSSAKISDDFFLVINHKFRISPCFPCFGYISLCFAKIIFSPLLSKMYPPIFEKFTCFLHTFCVFRFPLYFHHDAFMHARTGRPWKSTSAAGEFFGCLIYLMTKLTLTLAYPHDDAKML